MSAACTDGGDVTSRTMKVKGVEFFLLVHVLRPRKVHYLREGKSRCVTTSDAAP